MHTVEYDTGRKGKTPLRHGCYNPGNPENMLSEIKAPKDKQYMISTYMKYIERQIPEGESRTVITRSRGQGRKGVTV